MAHPQTLDTWTLVFDLVESADEHHQRAAQLEYLAASSASDVRAGLADRARLRRRLGDEAIARAEDLRSQRYEDNRCPEGR